jgi:hypothetical protein
MIWLAHTLLWSDLQHSYGQPRLTAVLCATKGSRVMVLQAAGLGLRRQADCTSISWSIQINCCLLKRRKILNSCHFGSMFTLLKNVLSFRGLLPVSDSRIWSCWSRGRTRRSGEAPPWRHSWKWPCTPTIWKKSTHTTTKYTHTQIVKQSEKIGVRRGPTREDDRILGHSILTQTNYTNTRNWGNEVSCTRDSSHTLKKKRKQGGEMWPHSWKWPYTRRACTPKDWIRIEQEKNKEIVGETQILDSSCLNGMPEGI